VHKRNKSHNDVKKGAVWVATGTVVSEKKIKTDNTLFDTFEPLVSFVYL
jgi:hypothetical protein